jgi:regulator of protease activity HflC (stomatin/prohibitin superfamily)
MAETPETPDTPDPVEPDDLGVPSEAPYGSEEDESTPRRAASAEFAVERTMGSEAMLREAMDPANQSLADALRLSFRVLQAVILVLLGLFVVSGVQTVEDGQSGVLLRWGRIVTVDGDEALGGGFHFSIWPYPAGEFVLFRDGDRRVDLGNRFWPDTRGRALDQAVEAATVHGQLRPGRDGLVLTDGGDIAHIRLEGRYDIDAPARFVKTVEDSDPEPGALDADRLVQLAMERATVHFSAKHSLAELIELGETGKAELMGLAQDLLDTVDSGISVQAVDTPIDPTPALAIKRAYGLVQEAREHAEERVEIARQEADKTLLATAGHTYPALVDLIEQYEAAFALDDTDAIDELLERIIEQLESPDTSGGVASLLSFARSYRSEIERTLGNEATRFESYLTAYREHPQFVINRLWLEMYGRVLSGADTEIIYAPSDGGDITIALAGLNHIRDLRRENALRRSEAATWRENAPGRPFIPRAGDITSGAGRQLDRSGTTQKTR